ncbi:M56 family metallopeptidase [Kitasatospora sp. DSM 101779]|uniref:M56 family metallopeptidase n=1 Tax=Kitasatospora sp. DSM 101779 TaxID=2853165 RepID=UPI0021D82FAF|nr:M56 family metallopeptidase [Kitasatospora sp. DSM 101779]MCU7823829.1 M56 family metallopeptidase [Kitasatospora sp. DSM 101779]
MGVFVFLFLPLVLPLTALPISRLAEQHLHPRAATRLLTGFGLAMAGCSALCLGLLGVLGTAQIPGNPLPDSWSDPGVRDMVPFHVEVGAASIGMLAVVLGAVARTLAGRLRVAARARRAVADLPAGDGPAVLPDDRPYAYALPGGPGRIVVSTGMMAHLAEDERAALLAHEQAHLTHRHHRYLLATRLAACVNPFLRPLHRAVAYSTERWADEEAAGAVGDRRTTARAVARAALVAHHAVLPGLPAFADPAPGPVPRRVAALLGPVPSGRAWPPTDSPAGPAAMLAAAGTAVSALSALNAATALLLVLKAATPL